MFRCAADLVGRAGMVHVGMMIRLIHLGDGEMVQRQRGSRGHVVEGRQEGRGRRQTRGGVEKSRVSNDSTLGRALCKRFRLGD